MMALIEGEKHGHEAIHLHYLVKRVRLIKSAMQIKARSDVC